MIRTDSLTFDTILYDAARGTRLVVLVDDSYKTSDGTLFPVTFSPAKRLIELDPALNLQNDEVMYLSHDDVWFAIEWILQDLVESINKGSNEPIPEDVFAAL